MTLYRFSARDGIDLPDLQASAHDTLVEARREAIRVLQRLAEVEVADPTHDWVVEVADEAGLPVFSLTLHFCDMPPAA